MSGGGPSVDHGRVCTAAVMVVCVADTRETLMSMNHSIQSHVFTIAGTMS